MRAPRHGAYGLCQAGTPGWHKEPISDGVPETAQKRLVAVFCCRMLYEVLDLASCSLGRAAMEA